MNQVFSTKKNPQLAATGYGSKTNIHGGLNPMNTTTLAAVPCPVTEGGAL